MATIEPIPLSFSETSPRGRTRRLAAIGVLCGLLATVAALLGWGSGLPGWRTGVNFTARWSVFVFLLLFLADPLGRLSRARGLLWLKDNQKGLLFAFAGAHFFHLGVILAYFAKGGTIPPRPVVVLGSFGYLLLAFLVATSSDRSIEMIGALRWRLLHTFVLVYLWLIFALTYVARLAKGPDVTVPGAVLAMLAAALIIRLVTPWRRPKVDEN
jgi:DMSO/TMAO reductase YedYZ heme-binding membrane subunit